MPDASAVEKVLDDHGVEYILREKLHISQINEKESRHNQARIGAPIDEEHAQMLALAMEDGAEIPPIVLYKEGAKYVIIDGNHRHFASQLLDRKTIRAYELIKPTAQQVRLLTFKINTMNGKPLSMDERIHHALDLAAGGTMTLKDAAKYFAVPENRVVREAKTADTVRRLTAMGLAPHKINKSLRYRLGSLRSDNVLAHAYALVTQTKMGVVDADALVVRVNKKRTEREQLEELDLVAQETANEYKLTAGGFANINHSIKNVRSVAGLLVKVDLDQFKQHVADIPQAGRKELKARCVEGARKLATAAELLS